MSDNEANQGPGSPGAARWRENPEQDGDRDPRRTQREPAAPNDQFDPRRTQLEPATPDSEFDPRQTQREPPADPAPDTGAAHDIGEQADEEVLVGLPPALRARYTVVRELPDPGAEADVLLVRLATAASWYASEAELRVVKVYRRNMHADHAVWAKLESLSSDSIVQFVETGTSGSRDYEVMEYLPGGNLTRLPAGRGALPVSVVTEVVQQVGRGLAELHGAGIVHRDLKPENVLIRQAEPLDVVVTDFGLSRAPEQSVVEASRTGTLAYLSPETLLHKGAHSSRARDWWALGMIARELLTGVRPFEEMTEAGIYQALMLRPVDLSDIADPRARLLCRGLLHRDPAERWDWEQVSEWLDGGTPALAEDQDSEPAAGVKPFVFQGKRYAERRQLARAFVDSWDEAVRRYFVAMGTAGAVSSSWRDLQVWLEQFRDADGQDPEALNAMIDEVLLSQSLRRDAKLLTLVRWLDPELPPVYRGLPADRTNLAAVAEHVAVENDPDAGYLRVIDDLWASDLLPLLGSMPGGGDLLQADVRWQEMGRRFEQRAQEVSPGLPKAARKALADASDRRRRAALLFLALDPGPHADKLRQHTEQMPAHLPAPVPWFDQLRLNRTGQADLLDDALLLVLFPLAARESAATDLAHKQAKDASKRSKRQWEELEEQRLAGNPASQATAYSVTLAAIMLAMWVISVIALAGSQGTPAGAAIADSVGSGLVGVGVGAAIITSETRLAARLGTDYAYYPGTRNLGRALSRVGSSIRGAGGGCVTLILLLILVPIAISLFFGIPAIGYAIIGVLHLRSWRQRSSAWATTHEAKRRKILGSAA